MSSSPNAPTQDSKPARGAPRQRGQRSEPRAPRVVHPVLEKLAALYPRMFGAQFLPLKLGTFQDLMAAHPGEFEPDDLKQALGQHTRSTRYLDSVARGMKRHDLQGQPVADLAVEHVHHAIVEMVKRKQARTPEDLQPGLRARLRTLFIQSGLSRTDYAAAAKINPESFGEMLDQADHDQAESIARREALMRAFEASGATPAAFADTYGMSVASVQSTLAQARQDRHVKQSRLTTTVSSAEPQPE